MRIFKLAVGIAGVAMSATALGQGTPSFTTWARPRLAPAPHVQPVTPEPPPAPAPGPDDFYVPPQVAQGQLDTVPQQGSRFAYWLAPYGTWQVDQRFGQVFVPSGSYVPFTRGSFALTTDGQIAFIEDDSDPIGWVVNHYGDWIWNGRWAWVPGDQWNAAPVAWSQDPSGQYIGWAPRPPEGMQPSGWQFAPRSAIFGEDVHHALLPQDRAESLVRTHRRVDRPDLGQGGRGGQGQGGPGLRNRGAIELNSYLLKKRADERVELEDQLVRQFRSERQELLRKLDGQRGAREDRERQLGQLLHDQHQVAVKDEAHLAQQQRERDRADWQHLRDQQRQQGHDQGRYQR